MIEFRAWDKEAKRYIDWDNFMNNSNGNWQMKVFNNGLYEFEPYSTLTDMDGKKIFKGDIVFIYDDEETEDGWWENVIFHRGCFMAGDDNLLANVHFRCRVIGNRKEGRVKGNEC